MRLRTANPAVGYRYIRIYIYYTGTLQQDTVYLYIPIAIIPLYKIYIHILQAKTTDLKMKIFNHLATIKISNKNYRI